MEMTKVTPELNLYDKDWPIWTNQEQMPPAKFVFDDDDRRGTAAVSYTHLDVYKRQQPVRARGKVCRRGDASRNQDGFRKY